MSTVPGEQRGPRRAATEDETRAMSSPLRLRILRLCLDAALTNKQIAEALGKDPASVLYHVRRLVDTGFLVPEPVRRGQRGSRERPYRATGKSWVLEVVEEEALRQGSAAVAQVFLDEIREIGFEGMYWSRLGLRLSRAEALELSDRLDALFEEFRARASGTEPWAAYYAVYPDRRPVENRHAEPGHAMTPSEDDD